MHAAATSRCSATQKLGFLRNRQISIQNKTGGRRNDEALDVVVGGFADFTGGGGHGDRRGRFAGYAGGRQSGPSAERRWFADKFFVKVYAGGLYLKGKSTDAAAIVAADEPMAIRMHFIDDGVSSQKLIATWNEGFANATGGATAALQTEIDQFNGFFSEEAKAGDVYDIITPRSRACGSTPRGSCRG